MIVKQSLSTWKVEVNLVAPEFGLELKRWLSGKKKKEKLQYVKLFTFSPICRKFALRNLFWQHSEFLFTISLPLTFLVAVLARERRFLNDFRRADFVENYNRLHYLHIHLWKTLRQMFTAINLLWKHSDLLESLSWPSLTFSEDFEKADFEQFPGGEWTLKYVKLSIQISRTTREGTKDIFAILWNIRIKIILRAYSYIHVSKQLVVMWYLIAINFHDQRPSASSTCSKPMAWHVTVHRNLPKGVFGENKLCFLGTW